MTTISNRASVLAIVDEVTEGVPVAPSSASQFVAIQDDFDMTPEFEQLENAELKNSLGPGKTILGVENPTVSMSHYLRHSGVEGQAPNFRKLLKGVFGNEDVESTQYDTVASSTTTVVKVDTGEGATYRRGQPLLVKDSVNGFSIRPVHSISGNDLTVGFALPGAPASGVNLGNAITYYPAESGHPSTSFWHYLGNGGATQLMSGGKGVDMSLDFAAGELINATFNFAGLGYYFNPIEITSSTRYLDFEDDDGDHAAVVAVKMYKDPHELAEALQTAMNTASTGQTATVTYSDTTGKYTIKTTGTLLELKWQSGANTANTIGTKLGFSVGADDTGTGATTGYTSDNALSFVAGYTPSFDSADPLAAKNNELFIGDAADTSCICASNVSFQLTNTRSVSPCVCSESGQSGSIFSAREVTVTVTALLEKYEAEKFRRFRSNEETRFLYNFGTKVGGNWVAGKCGMIYVPTATITSFNLSDQDGQVALEMELRAFVDSSGNGEVYLAFV